MKVVGYENLKEIPDKLGGPLTPSWPRYFAANIVIEPSPEGARGRAYMVRVAPTEANKPSEVTSPSRLKTFS